MNGSRIASIGLTLLVPLGSLFAQEQVAIPGTDGLRCRRQGSLGEVIRYNASGQDEVVDLYLERKTLLRSLQSLKKKLVQAQTALAQARKNKGKKRQAELRALVKKIEALNQALTNASDVSLSLDKCEQGTLLPPILSCSPLGATCDDGNSCTINDTCTTTGCVGVPYSGETISCGIGSCQRTVSTCLNGSAQNCIPGTPAIEVCNGMDDDCDGKIDEDLGQQSCGVGACLTTVENCVRGHQRTCFPKPPVPGELCNGIDDNCNGVVDEGGACPSTP